MYRKYKSKSERCRHGSTGYEACEGCIEHGPDLAPTESELASVGGDQTKAQAIAGKNQLYADGQDFREQCSHCNPDCDVCGERVTKCGPLDDDGMCEECVRLAHEEHRAATGG